MIKNLKISLILTAAFIILIIASIVLVSSQNKTPDGTALVEKLISACEVKSASKAAAVFDTSSKSKDAFAGCVTVDDYFYKCNIDFDLSSKDTVTKAYLIGIIEPKVEDDDAAALEELLSYYSNYGSYRYAIAFIGADYTDADGNEKSCVTECAVAFNDKTGKIYAISD